MAATTDRQTHTASARQSLTRFVAPLPFSPSSSPFSSPRLCSSPPIPYIYTYISLSHTPLRPNGSISVSLSFPSTSPLQFSTRPATPIACTRTLPRVTAAYESAFMAGILACRKTRRVELRTFFFSATSGQVIIHDDLPFHPYPSINKELS